MSQLHWKTKAERNAIVVRLYQRGVSLSAIARIMGFTRQRAHQIVRAHKPKASPYKEAPEGTGP